MHELHSRAVPWYGGGTVLVTNNFDGNGDPYPHALTIYPYGGSHWSVLITTTNDVVLYQAEIGNAQIVVRDLGGGMTWKYATNWSQLSIAVSALTNPVVKMTIWIPWTGQVWSGDAVVGYIMDNSGVLGGVSWNPKYPEAPPGPFVAPPTGVLAISRWTNNAAVVYWSTNNPPVTVKRANDPAGAFEAFDYVATTNIFGTNVVGTFMDSTNVAGFYRLYSN